MSIQNPDHITIRLDRNIAKHFVNAVRVYPGHPDYPQASTAMRAMYEHLLHEGRMPVFDLDHFAALVHTNAVDKGWWECEMCKGREVIEGEGIRFDENRWLEARVSQACPTCAGSGQHRNPAELIALIHSELSEALEALRKPGLDHVCDKCNGVGRLTNDSGHFPQECRKCRGTGELEHGRFAEEMADVLIRLLDTCAGLEVDLIGAAKAKHAYNVGRPRKHGKKF